MHVKLLSIIKRLGIVYLDIKKLREFKLFENKQANAEINE